MPSVCFYFQVHQPKRLRRYNIFDIGRESNYFDKEHNRQVLQKVARKCYYPANNLILELIERHEGRFKVNYSLSGVFLDQAMRYEPRLIESFQRLSETGCVEFLSETYYHSLASLYSEEEFFEQVLDHMLLISNLFKQVPSVFRNTELVYFDYLAHLAKRFHFKAILAEGWDNILGWRSPNFVYEALDYPVKLMLKNYRLSDDIAFRFSNREWKEWPLTADKFAHWVHAVNGNGQVVNLFMDYETFGEHQWEDTGIFNFMRQLPEEILRHPDMDFVTVSEEADRYQPVAKLSMPHPVSWADTERDISAWVGNDMQKVAIHALYSLEERVKETKDLELLKAWRQLQTSDHFYYMCTKWFSDGDVHKYFNAFERPHDAYIYFNNALVDFVCRVDDRFAEMRMISQQPEITRIEIEAPVDGLDVQIPGVDLPGVDLPEIPVDQPIVLPNAS
ncbi:MAG: glycoside hydrolase family 57 protein [Actinomycetota bacterium]|nr:glycoside hydrolase family 57 protein [Actinomycetota bacterium]